MKKTKKIVKINNLSIKRLKILEIIFFIALLLLVIRLIYLQFIQGSYLSAEASKNQTSTQIISPNRGTIYDANGKVLALSADVDTVSVNPSKLKYSNGNEVSKEFVARFI